MARKLTRLGALGALIGLTFALGPAELVRDVPTPPTPESLALAGTLVVDLVDGSDEQDLETIEGILGADLDWTHELSKDEALAQGQVSDFAEAMALLGGHPLVEVVEPELIMEHFAFPDDPMYERQWHMREMGAPEGWTHSARGEGVIVAVIDTGVTKVEDLDNTEILKGATFVTGTKTAADDHGHGTHVAGTIAQSTNNGKGVTGVAPEATILPVKVLSKYGFGSSSWIASGIDYAVDEGAEVINLSLGGSYSRVIHTAIKKARAKGVIVVAAAGNSGRKGVGYPGALAETIGVSATGPGGGLAPYSSWGKGVDIAAPGGDKTKPGGGVLQNTVDGKGGHHYAEYQGTSMATPHVAGAAAVLFSQGLPADAVERALLDNARPEKDTERFGSGHLDLGAALTGTSTQHGATRFALGGIFALLIAGMARTRSSFQLTSSAIGATVAGGMFFLGFLPVAIPGVDLLTRGFLEWPSVLFGPDWMHFPLWLSALIPGLAALTLGTLKFTRPLALGLSAGIAAHLFFGAATGTLAPWWMPTSLGTAWLAGNATLAVLFALAVAGAHAMDDKRDSA